MEYPITITEVPFDSKPWNYTIWNEWDLKATCDEQGFKGPKNLDNFLNWRAENVLALSVVDFVGVRRVFRNGFPTPAMSDELVAEMAG